MSVNDSAPSHPPYWREEAKQHVYPYREGLDLLGSVLEFSFERLRAADLTSEDLSGAGGKAVVPILAARAIGTVDAIHALLEVGRVEQAEMLVRTLSDLQADAFLLAANEDAIGFYADWAIVEQAQMAMKMEPTEIVSRDLEARRSELAEELVERLARVDMRGAEALVGRSLDDVLDGFCRVRYRSRRPSSWRRGYMEATNLSTDGLRALIIGKAVEVIERERVPDQLREEFEKNFERELELLFSHLSGEIHNSPLAMNRLIDQNAWTIRVHGDIEGLTRALAAGFQHLLRIMLLFEDIWIPSPAVSQWSDHATAVAEWMEGLSAEGA